MTERGIVTKIKGKRATVTFDRHAACDSCHMCAVTPTGKVEIRLINTLGAQVGDFVEVQMGEKFVLTAALIVYIIPLVLAGLGLGLGFLYNVWLALGLALGGVVIGFVIAYLLDKFVIRKKDEFEPKMTKIMTAAEVEAIKQKEKELLEAANKGIQQVQEENENGNNINE